MRNDAKPKLHGWRTEKGKDIFVGSHSGYQRLGREIRPIRTIVLDKKVHGILVHDEFESNGSHKITIPFHFVADTTFDKKYQGHWFFSIGGNRFELQILELGEWKTEIRNGWVSESYGKKIERPVIELSLIHI